ncbi:SAM-dependent methyltransferase [Paenibacillus gansuensis]|uniref:SAM-dependent methyltransferase n=1 Tax=Paenibacillus gansuensis TaxID=306542 RepID=A0ABW5PC43_9BACL
MTEQEAVKQCRLIGTSNTGFAQQAQEEIRRLFGSAVFTYIVPSEVFLAELPVDREEALRLLQANEPMFLRHIQPVLEEIRWTENPESVTVEQAEEIYAKLSEWLIREKAALAGKKIAVQIRRSSLAPQAIGKQAIKEVADAVLAEQLGSELVVRGSEQIVSVYIGKDRIYAGYSKPEENLSDWSGGAVRFQKEEGQISRAKFKLLEAEQQFGFSFNQFHQALDIGAAPGGWTSLLLERGLKVTAVDPAALAPQLMKHPKLTYLKKNAGDVKFEPGSFDLLVCDMSWSPRMMAKLVDDLLYAVRPGGNLIITVKLLHKKAFQTVREVLEVWEGSLQLLQAKQLFHNREELTLYLLRV